jgi:hypothetical protein
MYGGRVLGVDCQRVPTKFLGGVQFGGYGVDTDTTKVT